MATTGTVNGTDILLYSDGNAIGASTGASMSWTQNTIETTNKDTGNYSTFIAGRKAGTMSVEGMYALDETYGFSYLWGLFIESSTVTLRYSTEVSGDKYYQCDAIITSLDSDAPDNDNASFSASFQATGTPQEVELT